MRPRGTDNGVVQMPSRLGRYAVRRRIGSGGFATVWLAYDEQLDSPVAVKVLAENWTEDQHVRQRFLEEGRFLRKVESPYVVSVYDAGELDDGRPYLVMSYADQGTLADRLEVEGLTPAQALEVVRQVGAGLQALHERGVLHRDVKPANVLFRTVDDSRNGTGAGTTVRAMVADLGLGKALDMSSRLTMIAGTPTFVAPEQAQGEPLDPRADQYSLAALTYLLLSGRAPYRHASLSAAAAPVPPDPLSTAERPLPAEVESVVLRGLAVDREERWPDVAGYVGALEAALGTDVAGEAPAAWLPLDPNLTQPGARPTARPARDPLPDPVPPKRRRWRVLAGVGLAVALGVGAGVAAYLLEQSSEPDEATISDASGQLLVTVPHDWERAVAADGWEEPVEGGEFPALSVGTSEDWTETEDGEGVFLGIVAAPEIPERLPQHPECASAQEPVDDTRDGDPTRTVVFSDCPGGGVVVERAIQLATNRLLWVQIRSDDRATAYAVLEDVDTRGI